ncbi:hypothetical protein J19TS2_08690 [Cohnella xylanilytica]|uniref:sensor histidine kinase n=1 Tax=Cohnella xylanilytica TaxID=557555 RepID=UPI001B0180BD|nr:histidine kinase [Cohnella xylanilytica]GIO11314.1 hypothetical protein J19TS2_08690 [Cohnella xylanilytica]
MGERRRLAYDIHDTVGYTLTTALVQVEGIRRLLERGDDEGIRKLEALGNLLRIGLGELRQLLRQTEDGPEPDDLPDLEESLRGLMETTRDAAGAETSVVIDAPLRRLSVAQKKMIYYTVLEGLTNGLRHGESTRFELSLTVRESVLVMELANNGKPMACTGSGSGVGLSGMLARIASVGGSLEIEPGAEKGVRLRVRIPMADEQRDAIAASQEGEV